jgi:hypothetical protein
VNGSLHQVGEWSGRRQLNLIPYLEAIMSLVRSGVLFRSLLSELVASLPALLLEQFCFQLFDQLAH